MMLVDCGYKHDKILILTNDVGMDLMNITKQRPKIPLTFGKTSYKITKDQHEIKEKKHLLILEATRLLVI